MIFIWLTTSRAFRDELVMATTRNRRILLKEDFDIVGPLKDKWVSIIKETFSFYNEGESLADY